MLKAANSAFGGPILPDFDLMLDFMIVLFTCKSEEDSVKNDGSRVFTTFSPL